MQGRRSNRPEAYTKTANANSIRDKIVLHRQQVTAPLYLRLWRQQWSTNSHCYWWRKKIAERQDYIGLGAISTIFWHIAITKFYRDNNIQYVALEPVQDHHPLKWWKENSPRLPLLSKLAKKYLCIPATSLPSKQAFSLARYVVNQRRACLTVLPENVNMLSFSWKLYVIMHFCTGFVTFWVIVIISISW